MALGNYEGRPNNEDRGITRRLRAYDYLTKTQGMSGEEAMEAIRNAHITSKKQPNKGWEKVGVTF